MSATPAQLKRIIVIDDDEDLLFTMNYWLSYKSFVTIALPDDNNIDSIIQSFNPHMIVIDVRLKNADGRIICRHIKKELLFKNPVLLFSVHDFNPTDFDGYLADGFFIKNSDHLSMILYIMKHLQ